MGEVFQGSHTAAHDSKEKFHCLNYMCVICNVAGSMCTHELALVISESHHETAIPLISASFPLPAALDECDSVNRAFLHSLQQGFKETFCLCHFHSVT